MTDESSLRGEAAVCAEAKCGGCIPSTSVKSVSDTLNRLTAEFDCRESSKSSFRFDEESVLFFPSSYS